MNMLIQERNNYNETLHNSQSFSQNAKRKKLQLCLETIHLVLHSVAPTWVTFLVTLWETNLGYWWKEKDLMNPNLPTTLFRIHSLMIYSHLVDYNIVGDTKTPLLRCFPFISKLKGGDIITTGEYMNYQTFSNLQFRPLLKISFHSIHIDLRDTSGEKKRLCLSVSLGLFWCLERCAAFIFNTYDTTRWLLQDK